MTFAKSGTTVTLSGRSASLVPGTDINIAAHQNVIQYEDGSVNTRDRNVREWFFTLRFRCSDVTRAAVRSFIISTIQFQRYSFTFTPDSSMDAGAGAGAAVTVYLWQKDFGEKPLGYDCWEFSMLLRTISTRTGSPS